MIKRTLYFGNPAYLSLRQSQLVLRLPEPESSDAVSDSFKRSMEQTIPIEDIGVVVLDNNRITVTSGLISALLDNKVAIITCDKQRMPVGLMLPLSGNTIQSERFQCQLNASKPLKKQLWQQTIKTKILNQAQVLKECRNVEVRCMIKWADDVHSGDSTNLEGRAAVYYWANLFDNFRREREGDCPNNLLNYGYAILRAVVARSLVSSGLLPTFGIHHHNRYNAYCLADDIMEPYRPYVDRLVFRIYESAGGELDNEVKRELLSIPTTDVVINGRRSPLMVAVGLTTSSLFKCYSGEARRIVYPLI